MRIRCIPTHDHYYDRIRPLVDTDELYVIQGTVPGLKHIDFHKDMFLQRTPWLPEDVRNEVDPQLEKVGPEHWVRGNSWRVFRFDDEV